MHGKGRSRRFTTPKSRSESWIITARKVEEFRATVSTHAVGVDLYVAIRW